jgi:hypothetical protein
VISPTTSSTTTSTMITTVSERICINSSSSMHVYSNA